MTQLVSTLVIYDLTGRLTEFEGFLYDGPVDECKKGRETQEQNQKLALDNAKNYTGIQSGYRDSGDKIANALTPSLSGGLSKYTQGQYNNAMRQDSANANAERQQGFATLAHRGFGQSPMGAGASITNTANRDQMLADTNAYSKALDTTHNDLNTVLDYNTQQQQTYNPVASINAGSQAADVRSRMGSTLGDIMTGIQGVGGTIANIATAGGAGGFGMWGPKKSTSTGAAG